MDGCFRRTPTRTGWIENRNVAIEYRWSGPHRALCRNYGRVRAVEVIVTVSSAVSAVRQATSVIPIVFLRWQIDTVGSGLCLKPPEDRHRFPQSVRACTTAATVGASTGPRIRNRAPVLNSTSITPGDSGNLVLVAASVGTSNVNDANRAAPCNCRRQRNSWLACIPASRATADATAPGSIAAATMRSFSALDHLRRCRTEVTISACVFVIGSPPISTS